MHLICMKLKKTEPIYIHFFFQVENCDKLTKPRVALPNLKTSEPVCPDGQLQCGNGECIDKILFCDTKPDW